MKKLLLIVLILAAACKKKDYNADTLVKNAVVYTVDNKFSIANAIVISGGKTIAVGDSDSLAKAFIPRKIIDAGGKPIYPGFIDAHAHFYEYGLGLQEVQLSKTQS